MNDILNRLFRKESVSDDPEIQEKDERLIGKIIHLDENDGWGFIESRDIKFTRIFFHWTALMKPLHFNDLKFGQKVEFTPIEIPDKGIRAIKIKLVTGNENN